MTKSFVLSLLDTLIYPLAIFFTLYAMGYLDKWIYRARIFLIRLRGSQFNYDRLRYERRKYEAGAYADDTRPAD